MKEIHCVKARFSHWRKNAYMENPFVRVSAGGKAFIADLREFTDPGLLDRIPEGRMVCMGVQAYNDGTFWLHWLHSAKDGTLEPKERTDMARGAAADTLKGLAGLAGAVLLFFLWFQGEPGTGAMILGLGWLVCLVWSLCHLLPGLHRLFVVRNRSMRFVWECLERVKRGDMTGCVPLENVPLPAGGDGGLAKLLARLRKKCASPTGISLVMATGKAKSVLVYRRLRYRRQGLTEYAFACDGRNFSFSTLDTTPTVHGIFQSNHSLMLAEGDRVLVVAGQDGTVKVLKNFEDGCTYAVKPPSSRKTWVATLGVLLGMSLLVPGLLLVFTSFYRYGMSLDSLCRNSLMAQGFSIGGGISAVICFAVLGYYFLRDGSNSNNEGMLLALETLEFDNPANGGKPYLHILY